MYYPSYEESLKILENKEYGVIPICTELYSDIKTPIDVLRIFKNVSKHVFMLESVEDSTKWGRYTFLGYDPKMEITCVDGKMIIRNGNETSIKVSHPALEIRKILKEFVSPNFNGLPSFTGGLVGFFAYDYIKYSEPSLKLAQSDLDGFKDVDLMLFDKVIAFDNLKQKIILICNAKTKNFETEYKNALTELDKMAKTIKEGKPKPSNQLKIISDFKPLHTKEEYMDMVVKAKNYIKEGDIFQVVLSNRLDAEIEGDLLDTYRVLRTINPSPYMFYFSSLDMEIAGASPETLVKLENRKLSTFPLAGTRPRGKTEAEDIELEKELLADEKELAEHNMLVDLGRNDIGKVSKIGSVQVEDYLQVSRYSHVMHIGSTVTGIIKDDKDALDAIDAILPAGTLSGAPKLRACEIINELEQDKRGIYGGAIGYLDFKGNLDTCISIRLAFSKGNRLYVRSGAGIVYDSVPEKEHNECINKCQAVINAIKIAEGGID